MSRLTTAQRTKAFGAPCKPENLVTVLTPWGIKARAHRLVADQFLHACDLAAGASSWEPRRIDSYACRTVRGSVATSLHAYGLAWDLFDKPLPQAVDVWGPTNAPDDKFLGAFSVAGFYLGADFTTRRDVPHVEWATGVPKVLVVPAKTDSITPAALAVPLIKITHSRLGEASGMVISTHHVDIPALDKDGRGWFDIAYPLERVTEVAGLGSSPVDDGYWPPLTVNYQPRGAVTRVTVAGQAGQHCGVIYKILEST